MLQMMAGASQGMTRQETLQQLDLLIEFCERAAQKGSTYGSGHNGIGIIRPVFPAKHGA